MKERRIKNIIYHLIFWIVSFAVLLRFFTKEYFSGTVDIIYTLLFHIPLFIAVCLNYVLIDNFFAKTRYFVYTMWLLVLMAMGIGIYYLVMDFISPFIAPGFYFISMPAIEITQYIVGYLFVSLLFKLSINWFDLKTRQVELEKINQEVQLSNLKAQLNPHFLFNSLNNIYSLSGSENNLTRKYILKLSDALRYMLYRTGSDLVNLEDEIDYLMNYIELEKLRLENNASVKFKYLDDYQDMKIAPLMLLPFVENCFKHCDREQPKIAIEVSLVRKELILECANNKSEEVKEGGLGLINAKKRLDLLYPDRYVLKVDNTGTMYKVHLRLQLI